MIVLDSDVIIDVVQDRKPSLALVAQLESQGETLATTLVNVAELRRGLVESESSPARRAALEELLANLEILALDDASARRYGSLMGSLDRAGRPLHPLDGLVAAIALENGGRLATRNRKHFERVAGLEILGP